jgi:repressor LexA
MSKTQGTPDDGAPDEDTLPDNVVSLPETPADSTGLSKRQKMILDFITATTTDRGYPPSVREIMNAVGLSSTSSVSHQLTVLKDRGFINKDATRARALEVRTPEPTVVGIPEHLAEDDLRPEAQYVPLVGRIAAGGPILAEQTVEDVFPLPRALVGEGELFMLKVSGESMIDAAICDGDFVVVRRQSTCNNGDIVAALIDGETTLKRFVMEKGKPFLRAENSEFPDLVPARELIIQGVLVALLRKAA